ncbi:hypothetical protein NCS52_01104400 [Fusarium sp. LHS14.1]|nr:hypothetical protein NCS52_01104400 [Fusarium sp. LHS14.1]
MAPNSVRIELQSTPGEVYSTLDKKQLAAVSGYFAKLFASEDGDKHVISDEYKDGFMLFSFWLREGHVVSGPESRVYKGEPWLSNTAKAWVVSRKFEAPKYGDYCLKMFINNCALAPLGPWQYVQDNTPPDSPIRRFSNHYVAWKVNILRGLPSEFDGLEAVTLAAEANGDIEDPRQYNYAHWYSPCGDQVDAACEHSPKAMREKKYPRPSTPVVPEASVSTTERGISLEVPPSRRGSQSTRPLSSRVSSSRQNRHSRISYESRPVSPASSDSSISPRRRFWLRFASTLAHGTFLTIILALCTVILPNESDGVRSGTRFYSIFCVSCGILCSLLPKLGIPTYILLALGDGIALAINTKSCCEMAESPICHKLKALTVFVWLGIPVSWWFRTAWGTNALISWRRH